MSAVPEPESPEPETAVVRYRERLHPGVVAFLAPALIIPAAIVVFLPIALWAGIAVGVALYAAIAVALWASTPTVEVTDFEFRAGRASIPRDLLGAITPADGEEAFAERGPRLDARAWLMLRPWARGVVKVVLADPEDPTPYWLVSSRRPEELAKALGA